MAQASAFKRTSLAEQLAERIEEEIRSGRREARSRLPGVRTMAQHYNVSLNTVLAALRLLEDRNLIHRDSSRACRVRDGAVNNRLARRRGSHIAVISPGYLQRDPHELWIGNIILSIGQVLDGRRFAIPMGHDYTREGLQQRLLPRLNELGNDLAGAVIFPMGDGMAPLAAELDRRGVPWVTIDPPHERAVFNFVTVDNLRAGQRVGQCLAQIGFRRVMILRTHVDRYLSILDKVTGCYRGFVALGAPTQGLADIKCRSIHDDSAYQQTLAYLDEHGTPDAIYVTHDLLAVGALRACRERGVRVPEDVSVVGCMNLPFTANWDPPLTVISQPMEEMARQAVEMIDQMHAEGVQRLLGRFVPGTFIFRQSLRISDELRRELEAEDQQNETFSVGDPVHSHTAI